VSRRETESSLEGTRLHALAAGVLRGEIEPDDVDPADWDVICTCVHDVEAALLAAGNGAVLTVEHQLRFDSVTGQPDATLKWADGQRMITWDFKFGRRVVEAVQNRQLITYAILERPDPGCIVEVRIIQPRTPSPIRSWVIPDLDVYRVGLREQLAAPLEFRTGSHCLYCPVAGRCPALSDAAMASVDLAHCDTEQLPPELVRNELVVLQQAKDLITHRLDALEAETEERIKAGYRIAGCVIRRGGTRPRRWTADADTVRLMTGKDPMAPAQMISPAQLIKAGANESVVEALTERPAPAMKLSTDAVAASKEAFGG
jgi:hypothetical protein